MMDTRFIDACDKIIGNQRERALIGTLSEKTLHAVLKNYFEPREECHEIKLGSFFADILNENGITEIQTRNLSKLCKKLDFFLQDNKVTLVLPIPSTKYVCWIDPETGEVTKRHKSPKHGKPYHCFHEVYGIKDYLSNENLTLCLVMIDTVDYRNLNGWSKDKKRGSTRYDTIPEKIVEEIYLRNPKDYFDLINFSLPEEFTSADFKKASKVTPRITSSSINLMCHLGFAEKIGKKGRFNLYRLTKSQNLLDL